MDLEELKTAWKQQSALADSLQRENAKMRQRLGRHGIMSARDRLVRSYRLLGILALVCVPQISLFPRWFGGHAWVYIVFALFTAVLGAVNIYMYRRFKQFDPSALSVREALVEITSIIEFRRRFQLWGRILVGPIVGLLLWQLCDLGEHYTALCGLIGGVIGATVGYFKDRRMKRDLDYIRQQLNDALTD